MKTELKCNEKAVNGIRCVYASECQLSISIGVFITKMKAYLVLVNEIIILIYEMKDKNKCVMIVMGSLCGRKDFSLVDESPGLLSTPSCH